VSVTLLELGDRLGGLASRLGPEALRPVWPVAAQMAAADCRENIAQGHAPDGTPWVPLAHGRPGQPAGAKPLRDRGFLLASITGRPLADGIAVGSNLEYAGVHQYGAVIRPKKGKYLAIPLTVVAKRAGSPRSYPGKLSPRISRKTGKGVLVDEATDLAQYALVPEVTVPARPFLGFGPVLIDRIGRLVTDRVGEVAARQLNGGG
jgi:phage gpG-like protein